MGGATIGAELNFGIGSESRYELELLWGNRNRLALFRKAEILGEGKRILVLVVRTGLSISGLEGKKAVYCGPIISKESTGSKRKNKRVSRTSTRM